MNIAKPKKLMYSIGFNSGGKYKTRIDDKQLKVHNTWANMIMRCGSPEYQLRKPAYVGCSVDERFYDYQDFAEWFDNHEYSSMGYDLDKDLLIPDNKIYSPETCVFIPHVLNISIIGRKTSINGLPQGVCKGTTSETYTTYVNKRGKTKYLGTFRCPIEASKVYKEAKEQYVKELALEWQDRIAPEVFDALINWRL